MKIYDLSLFWDENSFSNFLKYFITSVWKIVSWCISKALISRINYVFRGEVKYFLAWSDYDCVILLPSSKEMKIYGSKASISTQLFIVEAEFINLEIDSSHWMEARVRTPSIN